MVKVKDLTPILRVSCLQQGSAGNGNQDNRAANQRPRPRLFPQGQKHPQRVQDRFYGGDERGDGAPRAGNGQRVPVDRLDKQSAQAPQQAGAKGQPEAMIVSRF